MANASELRDVRIGEYEDFARVVFEFSEAVTPQDINDNIPGKLTIQFPNTQPGLIRKIPIDNSYRIKDAQLWQKGTTVSAILIFPFDHYRLDYFTLSEPHRIAIDIFPLKTSSASAAGLNRQPDTNSALGDTDANTASPNHSSMPPVTADGNLLSGTSEAFKPPSEHNQSQPDAILNTMRKPTLIGPVDSVADQSTNSKASFTSRLQYYLVIGLVIIIVIVLILLVLMLLSRDKTRNAISPLSTDEYFQRQDETIASINARIHEQLKRYDEA